MTRKLRTFGIVLIALICIGLTALNGEGTRIALWNPDYPITIRLTDTICDTVYATVAAGAISARGIRVNGANWPSYGFAVAGDDDSLWFDTAVVTVPRVGHAAATVLSVTKTATAFRLTFAAGTHFDSVGGTIFGATDTITVDVDSGGTTKHFVMSSDSAIGATVLALDVSQAVEADTFVGWNVVAVGYHLTIGDDIDSFATHVELDTTWGNRSFDSLWFNAARAHAVQGWTAHGLKRGGHVTDTIYTSPAQPIPLAEWYQWRPMVFKVNKAGVYNRDSIYISIALQTRLNNHDYSPWVTLKTVTANDTTLDATNWLNLRRFPPDTDTLGTTRTYGHIGDYARTVVTVTDSASMPALYGRISVVNIFSDLIIIQ